MSAEYFPYQTLEYISALKIGLLELDQELKNEAATKEETVEMNSEIWSKLPQELLMRIIAQLPTLFSARFRAVCKGWKHLLSPEFNYQMLQSTVVQSSFPAFLISGVRYSNTRNLVQEDLSLLQALPSLRMYKLPLNFCPYELNSVVTCCRSFLCCFGLMERKSTLFICNPMTRTFKTLPSISLLRIDFCGFSVDASTRTFILVMGLNNCINGVRNNMEINMYDSESDRWTQMWMSIPLSIAPIGEGVYSRGRFYWINVNHSVQGWTTRFDVAIFDAAANHWTTIRPPQR
ncbi:hypothetical protein SUGI_0474060 [Cryptomeria japonica]|nr:hypothetical protein SUGI_0474060 [Cryptomeria japonica]